MSTLFNQNPILAVDSYKHSHFLQYPNGTTNVYSYIEARNGGKFDRTLFFGLQIFLLEWLSRPITMRDIDYAEHRVKTHGLPFNREGWEWIVTEHGGKIPVVINAVREGSVVETGNVLLTIENTDRKLPWLTQFVETALLRAVWYPTTVATLSWHAKKIIYDALVKSSDDPKGQLPFKLHDFGGRGVSSAESAAIGGAAHLVNFMGTDTMEALELVKNAYHEEMAGFSIPAAEHSTITTWGRDGEYDAFRNMLTTFARPGKIVAVVSDSYDLRAALNKWGEPELRQQVVDSGALVVIRPDSGDPITTPLDALYRLAHAYGTTTNSKGYSVVNNVRVIQGDGMNLDTLKQLVDKAVDLGWSIDNLAFGMGGGLLQQVNRDTIRFAQKASAVKIDGVWHNVNKAPATDPTKASKAGRFALIREDGKYQTIEREGNGWRNELVTVYHNGNVVIDDFASIRQRSEKAL